MDREMIPGRLEMEYMPAGYAGCLQVRAKIKAIWINGGRHSRTKAATCTGNYIFCICRTDEYIFHILYMIGKKRV